MIAAQPQILAFRNVRAIDPAQGLDAVIDVLVERGRITRMGPQACAEVPCCDQSQTLDAGGMWLLPGLVELHAHLREPGFSHKEDIVSGLRAAAAGGFAHVCAMPNTSPACDSPQAVAYQLDRAHQVCGPTLHPIAAITRALAGCELTDMSSLRKAGAAAFSDDGRCVMSSHLMRRALQVARDLDVCVMQHAEDHSMTKGAVINEGPLSQRLGLRGWPHEAEEVIVARDLVLALSTGARYHVSHASTNGTVELLRWAKGRGDRITAEVTPHHLLLTEDALQNADPLFKVAPPLRSLQDVRALRCALIDTTIDCIATDHAPHDAHEKAAPLELAPPGMIGLELCLPLMLGLVRDGELPLQRAIDALSSAPARVLGIQRPTLQQGAIAELCLLNPQARWLVQPAELHSKSHNTPFLGRELQGRIELTMARGMIIYQRSAGPDSLG